MQNNNQNNFDEFDNEEAKQESKRKKSIRLILIFLIVFALLFVGVNLGLKLYNRYMIERPVETTTSTGIESTEPRAENPIDFASLQEQNGDIYAYIKVPDTVVDYPIVQSPDDDAFYLRHSAEDKSWSASGAIYTEFANNKDFNDRVTVIYGHNGYGDTFFTTLHKFESEEFFNSHPYFYIYTPDRKLTYQIISAFKYDDRHIMNSFNFSNGDEFLEFQQYILNPTSALKNVRTELETTVDIDSRIAVLSTCITNQKSSRYLVCGVLINDEKTY